MFLEYRKEKERSLADLLPWAVFANPSFLILKNGGFLGGFIYRGPDLESSSPEELDRISRLFNQGLQGLGEGVVMHATAIRRRSDEYSGTDVWPDPVTAIIEEERKRRFTRGGGTYSTEHYLIFTKMPGKAMKKNLASILLEPQGMSTLSAQEKELEAWDTRLSEFQAFLERDLRIRRIKGGEILSHLYECLTGEQQPVRNPEATVYVDSLLATAPLRAGFKPMIGDKRIGIISIKDFPRETHTGILNELGKIPTDFRWTTRFIKIENSESNGKLNAFRRYWKIKESSIGAAISEASGDTGKRRVNIHAENMVGDVDEAIGLMSSGEASFGYYTGNIVVLENGEYELQAKMKKIASILKRRGFTIQIEAINAVDAWRGTLPGDSQSNVRKPLVSTINCSDLLALTAIWTGDRYCPNPLFPKKSPALLTAKSDNTPFFFNPYYSDMGNTLVVGPPGSGKSTFIVTMAAQFMRYPKAKVFVFDRGYSFYALAKACGAQHYSLGGEEGSPGLQPLSRLKNGDLGWLCDWVEGLLSCNNFTVKAEHRIAIETALKQIAAVEGSAATIRALRNKIQSREVREVLTSYTKESQLGPMLDADQDELHISPFIVFELSHLMEKHEHAVGPVLTYLFHRIDQRLDGNPTIIFLDEAWSYLLVPAFAQRIVQWLRELRKKNAIVVFSTQSLNELHGSEYSSIIHETTQTKIFLANSMAKEQVSRPLYESLGLNPRQIEIIAQSVPKRDYYFMNPGGRRLLDLDLGKIALAFVGISSPKELAQVREHESAHGNRWPIEWLRTRGENTGAERLQEIYESERHSPSKMNKEQA